MCPPLLADVTSTSALSRPSLGSRLGPVTDKSSQALLRGRGKCLRATATLSLLRLLPRLRAPSFAAALNRYQHHHRSASFDKTRPSVITAARLHSSGNPVCLSPCPVASETLRALFWVSFFQILTNTTRKQPGTCCLLVLRLSRNPSYPVAEKLDMLNQSSSFSMYANMLILVNDSALSVWKCCASIEKFFARRPTALIHNYSVIVHLRLLWLAAFYLSLKDCYWEDFCAYRDAEHHGPTAYCRRDSWRRLYY